VLVYLARRLLTLVPLWILCAIVIFLLVHLIPGDPALTIAGSGATEEQLDLLRADLGLDLPLPVRFWRWFSGLLVGDLGTSVILRVPVASLLLERLAPTLQLAVVTTVLSITFGFPVGLVAAVQRGRRADRLLMALAAAGLAVPSFLMAILMILAGAVYLDWFPVRGYVPLSESPSAWALHMVLPALSYAFVQASAVARMTRSSCLEVLDQDYVRTARSKGLGPARVVLKHAVRNALIPVVTLLGLNLGAILVSAVVVETIFGIPGVGALMVSAIFKRDYTLVQGGVLLTVTLFFLVNLIVDVLYRALDPRIRYG